MDDRTLPERIVDALLAVVDPEIRREIRDELVAIAANVLDEVV